MTSKVLISGARAPSALEIARQFSKAQTTVHVADCTQFPISRYSRHIDTFHKISSPRFEYSKFSQQILDLQKKNNYDLIIPTCEEVFFFAKLKKENDIQAIFCDDFDKLVHLHSKWDFFNLSQDWSIKAPATLLLEKYEDWVQQNIPAHDYVFKPVFSRFAAQTMISPSPSKIQNIDWQKGPWVAQKRIYGDEICVYIVANKGKLKAFSAYNPTYRAGLGAGIYLEPYFSEAVFNFCKEFVEKMNFHGQAAFDLMKDKTSSQYWLLECNPRTTSGVHFFDHNLTKAFLDSESDMQFGDRQGPKMIASAMAIYGLPKSFSLKKWKLFLSDWNKAKDVVWNKEDCKPFWGQYISFLIFCVRAALSGQSAISISSGDIEYNG